MITAIVQFQLPNAGLAGRGHAHVRVDGAEISEPAGPHPQILLRLEDGRTAGGVYSGSRGGGGEVYSGEWRERVAKLYGNAPQVTYFDTPVIVDNSLGGAITKAAHSINLKH